MNTRTQGSPRPRLTADGYTVRAGSPTSTQVQLDGEARWRRVYVLQFSNAATYFVRKNDKAHILPGFYT